METFKLSCFAKLSVPALALGLPMDVLTSIGVLRLEKSAAAAAAAKKTAEKQQQERDATAVTCSSAEGTSECVHDATVPKNVEPSEQHKINSGGGDRRSVLYTRYTTWS